MIQRMIAARAHSARHDSDTGNTERFRALATKLFRTRLSNGQAVTRIAVTSCQPRAGVTSTVAGLAQAAASEFPRVIALEFERPRHDLVALLTSTSDLEEPATNNAAGAVSAVADQVALDAEQPFHHLFSRTRHDTIFLAQISRESHANNNGASIHLHDVLPRVPQGSMVLIADLPPIGEDTTTVSVVSQFDGILLVVQAEKTRRSELRRAFEKLQQSQANVVGVIINNSRE